MRILMTSDALGGVGVYADTLARVLVERGHRVTVAILGGSRQREESDGGVRRVWAPFRLEWMSGEEAVGLAAEIVEARAYVCDLAERTGVEILHANQFAFVDCAAGVPSLLVAHSDVVSWWRAVHGKPPPATAFYRWYAGLVRRALERAEVVVAPSQAALEDLERNYGYAGPGTVIANGLAAEEFPLAEAKREWAVTVGRLWDEGKQAHLLQRKDLGWPTRRLGPTAANGGGVERQRVLDLLARARLYVGTSRYEPFGLAVLEAALSGCALLLNDIPSFHEVWGGDAAYFAANDGEDLALQMRRLAAEPETVRALAAAAAARARHRYGAQAMAARYETLYRRLLGAGNRQLTTSN